MEPIRCRDHNRLNIFAFEHRLQAGIGVLNLKLVRHLAGAGAIDIGHGDQLRPGNQATQILRVPFAHVPNAQHPHTQLTHPFVPPRENLYGPRA